MWLLDRRRRIRRVSSALSAATTRRRRCRSCCSCGLQTSPPVELEQVARVAERRHECDDRFVAWRSRRRRRRPRDSGRRGCAGAIRRGHNRRRTGFLPCIEGWGECPPCAAAVVGNMRHVEDVDIAVRNVDHGQSLPSGVSEMPWLGVPSERHRGTGPGPCTGAGPSQARDLEPQKSGRSRVHQPPFLVDREGRTPPFSGPTRFTTWSVRVEATRETANSAARGEPKAAMFFPLDEESHSKIVGESVNERSERIDPTSQPFNLFSGNHNSTQSALLKRWCSPFLTDSEADGRPHLIEHIRLGLAHPCYSTGCLLTADDAVTTNWIGASNRRRSSKFFCVHSVCSKQEDQKVRMSGSYKILKCLDYLVSAEGLEPSTP